MLRFLFPLLRRFNLAFRLLPPSTFSLSLFPCFPSLLRTRSRPREFAVASFSLQHMNTWHFLSPLVPPPPPFTASSCGRERESESGVLSCLTQAGGVKRGMSLALPLPAAVAGAQTLEQVALGVALAPGVADPVGGERVLVVAAVCWRGAPRGKDIFRTLW